MCSTAEFGRVIPVSVSDVGLKCRLKLNKATSTSYKGRLGQKIAINVAGAGENAAARYMTKCPRIIIELPKSCRTPYRHMHVRLFDVIYIASIPNIVIYNYIGVYVPSILSYNC